MEPFDGLFDVDRDGKTDPSEQMLGLGMIGALAAAAEEEEARVQLENDLNCIPGVTVELNFDVPESFAEEELENRIEELREQLEELEDNEPPDMCGEAYDAWEEKRDELEEKIEELQDILDEMED